MLAKMPPEGEDTNHNHKATKYGWTRLMVAVKYCSSIVNSFLERGSINPHRAGLELGGIMVKVDLK